MHQPSPGFIPLTALALNLPDLVSGIALDGYVAGATVFQDLNNNGVLNSGEPSTSTNSLGSFSLNLTSVDINAPVRIINGFDLASNEIHPSIMDISVSETGSYIVTPISTLVGRLKIEDTSLSNAKLFVNFNTFRFSCFVTCMY